MTHAPAYLQFGGAFTNAPNGPYQTLDLSAHDVRETAQPRHGRTVSGYGYAIPTHWQVRHNGRWYRVYCCQYGNAGTCYIRNANRQPIATVN